jgi:hypothetical protein
VPQLLSRIDQSGWLTPSIADILEQGATPPGGEQTIRSQAMELQRALTEQGAPTRIVNVRPTSSRTLYIARPDLSNRFVRKQIITQSDITRSFTSLTDTHPDWTLGFLPKMQDNGAIGILLRTQQHRSIRLRQLMIRNAYREHESNLALVMGITLEQQLVVRDLAAMGHMLIVGAETNRRPYLWGTLLTLLLLNTPGELRLALAGAYSQAYNALLDTPHVLGKLLGTPKEGQRLLDGLVKEVQRRTQWFEEMEVTSLDAYNQALAAKNAPPLPRIVFLVDSLTDPNWKAAVESWTPSVYDLLINAARTGIHLLLTTNHENLDVIPDMLLDSLHTKVMLQSPGANLREKLRGLPELTHRFVDAVLVENEKEERAQPLELFSVTDEEIQRTASYWKQASTQRVPKPAGTGMLNPATGVTTLLPAVRDTGGTQEMQPATPNRPNAETLSRATEALAQNGSVILSRAQALAAYLGWLGVGPLQDVLGLSADEAQAVMGALKNSGVLEADNTTAPRFVRLAANPLANR